MNPTVATTACERGRLPSDSTLRDMYGPLDQKDIDRMAQVSAALNVPHDWSPCDDAGAVGVGPGMSLCITTRHTVGSIACDFACSVHMGRERRVALGVRRERHGWVLYFAVVPGADLPGAMIVPAGTFGSPLDSGIAAAVRVTYPKMASPSCSVIAGLCGAMSAHAQRWLPPYVLDRTVLLQSVWVTENGIADTVRTLAKAVKRPGSGARRLVLSPRPHEFQSSLIHLSYATEPIDADKETVDCMEEGAVDEAASIARTQAPVPPPPSARHQTTDQGPVALLGLYPDMTTSEAVRVLAIADSLADVPHQWTAQPAGDVSVAVHDLGAPPALVKKTVHSVGQGIGGQRRVLLCALRRDGAYTHLRMAAERPASTPKVQTVDDLLDLYPDVTAREIVALARVIGALTGTPTDWVPSRSGHVFDGQGPFAPTESVARRIADAVRPLVLSRSSSGVGAVPHHAVLTIDRDQNTRDLVYRFAVVPTSPSLIC
nr:hypothetical protein [Pandoravirus belohorizontensis]